LDDCADMPRVSEKERLLSIGYLNMVSCDACSGDIFNAYVMTDQEETFCMLNCKDKPSTKEVYLCVPRSFEELLSVLDSALKQSL